MKDAITKAFDESIRVKVLARPRDLIALLALEIGRERIARVDFQLHHSGRRAVDRRAAS